MAGNLNMMNTKLPTVGGTKSSETSADDQAAPDRPACKTNSSSTDPSIEFTDPRKNLKTMRLLNELMGTLLLQLMIDQEVL